MSTIYPYNQPIILNEDIAQAYGIDVEKASSEMQEAAYTIAEQFVTDDIGTFLLPTTVTGTYSFNLTRPIVTDYAYVQSVNLIQFLDVEEDVYYSVVGTDNVYVSVRDSTYGIVDIHSVWLNCRCSSSWGIYPYKVNVSYTAGLPTGTANNPKFLMALSMTADLILNQLLGYGNEADGLVGVSEFKNQDYSEKRHNLKRTVYGSSARAQLISDLVASYKVHQLVGL